MMADCGIVVATNRLKDFVRSFGQNQTFADFRL